MQQSADIDNSLLERRLMREIKEVEAKIAELQENKRSLERLLVKIRRENAATKDVTRKNSWGAS